MREVTIDEHRFVIGDLDPKRAFHVVRRLAPLIGPMREFIPYLIGGQTPDMTDLNEIANLLEPLAQGLAQMPEADANYIIDVCLSVVQYRIPGDRGLAPVSVGGHLMFDWIKMPTMIRLVFEVVTSNFEGFTPAGASAS